MFRDDVPPRVVISEYVDIAHAFFSGDEPKVVNGVLDRLGHKMRPQKFTAQGPADG
jgi:N utilization substance protein B